MNTDVKNLNVSRIMAIALVLIMVFTLMPVFHGQVHGASKPVIIERSNWAKPTNYPSQYDVYRNHFVFNTKGNYAGGSTKLYVDYRKKIKGNKYGPWKRSAAMGAPYSDYMITGLSENAVYQTRTYYGLWKGNRLYRSRYSSLFTFRTGSRIYVKSVRVQPVNIQTKRQHVFGYVVYWGSIKFYRCQYKVTVTLSRKPGAAGLMINNKKSVGNKLKYTVYLGPFDSYSKPQGKKYTVLINSYKSWRYGGWSQPVKKTVVVR